MLWKYSHGPVSVGDRWSSNVISDFGPCELCQEQCKRIVDHCHEHKVIRGEICQGCNVRIGQWKADRLYLERCSYCSAAFEMGLIEIPAAKPEGWKIKVGKKYVFMPTGSTCGMPG